MNLRRSIEGISQRMLTVTLRNLERDGLISRTVYAVVPPRVDYALTPLGRTLRHTVDDLVAWVEHHVGEIELAKASYDGRMRTRGVLPKSRLTDQSIHLKKFQGG